MDKRKVGSIFGVMSILTVIICIIIFFIVRGPNVDIQFVVTSHITLGIIGILFAIISWFMSKRILFLIIGLLGNIAVLIVAYFLLLALGISEP